MHDKFTERQSVQKLLMQYLTLVHNEKPSEMSPQACYVYRESGIYQCELQDATGNTQKFALKPEGVSIPKNKLAPLTDYVPAIDISYLILQKMHTKDQIKSRFLPFLPEYLTLLDKAEGTLFALNIRHAETQKKLLADNLRITQLLIKAQMDAELAAGYAEKNRIQYLALLEKCTDLIQEIEQTQPKPKPAPTSNLDSMFAALHTSFQQKISAPASTVFLDFKQSKNYYDTTTKYMLGVLEEANNTRINGWAFSNSDLLATEFNSFHMDAKANQKLGELDNIAGHLSYIIYIIRLGLLAHQVAKYGWESLSDNDKNALENDAVWIFLNGITFWYLRGNTPIGHGLTLGEIGGMVTIVGLFHDLIKLCIILESQYHAYQVKVQEREQIIAHNKNNLSDPYVQEQLQRCTDEMQALEKNMALTVNNIRYMSIGIVGVSLSLMGHMLLGPVASMLLTVSAVLDFVNVVSSILMEQGVEIYGSWRSLQKVRAQKTVLENQRDETPNADQEAAIHALAVEAEYQLQLMEYQFILMLQTLMVKLIVHSILFFTISFLPLYAVILCVGMSTISAWLTECFVISPALKPTREQIQQRLGHIPQDEAEGEGEGKNEEPHYHIQ